MYCNNKFSNFKYKLIAQSQSKKMGRKLNVQKRISLKIKITGTIYKLFLLKTIWKIFSESNRKRKCMLSIGKNRFHEFAVIKTLLSWLKIDQIRILFRDTAIFKLDQRQIKGKPYFVQLSRFLCLVKNMTRLEQRNVESFWRKKIYSRINEEYLELNGLKLNHRNWIIVLKKKLKLSGIIIHNLI